MQNPLRAPQKKVEGPKVVRPWRVFYILTLKCASHHNRMHFFNSSASKSASNRRCLRQLFDMCFPPQPHALFQHLNFQKCSALDNFFLRFSRRNCASRHFRPSGAAKLEKNTLSRDFSTFSRALTFFLLISLSDLFSTDSLFSDFFSFLTVLVTAAASLHESEI